MHRKHNQQHWFFCLTDYNTDYFDLLKACVTSAKTNTSLIPNCIYFGKQNHITKWLEDQNVNMIYHTPSYYEHFCFNRDRILQKIKENNIMHSVPIDKDLNFVISLYMRIDIPHLTNEEYILYTDIDTIFLKDINLDDYKPETIAAVAVTNDYKYYNSGVMIMNTNNLKKTHNLFTEFIRENLYVIKNKVSNWDEQIYNTFYPNYLQLPLSYNWRPYQPISNDTTILHFTGAKPKNYKEILSGDHSFYKKTKNYNEKIINIRTNEENIRYHVNLWNNYCENIDTVNINNIVTTNLVSIQPPEKIKDPLIILGNGPSLKNVNFDLLKSYDCFGLKSQYKHYEKINWWPKYWSPISNKWLNENHERKNEIVFLIKNKVPIEYFIFLDSCPVCDCYSNVIKILTAKPYIFQFSPINSIRKAAKILNITRNIDTQIAENIIYKNYAQNNLPDNITPEGFIKVYDNIKLEETDYYENPFNNDNCDIYSYKSYLDEFYYTGGSSGLAAVRIGICLGYKKIILLGFDNNYQNNIEDCYFSKDILSENDEVYKEKQKRPDTWEQHTKMINYEHYIDFENFIKSPSCKDIDVVNCSENSNLNCVRKSTLEKELL